VVWSDFRQVIIDTAVDQWRKRLQACAHANGEHFEHLLWTNSCKQFAFFMCFWFKWLLSIVSAFYCVYAWWLIGLLCKALSLLRTVNEQNVNHQSSERNSKPWHQLSLPIHHRIPHWTTGLSELRFYIPFNINASRFRDGRLICLYHAINVSLPAFKRRHKYRRCIFPHSM